MGRLTQFVLYLCVLAMTLCVVGVQAHAAFISFSDSRFGIDSVTLDTNTGLQWLDVPLSQNRSYNDIAVQFGTGGDFEGFRYATPSEVTNLFNSFGLVTGPANATHTQFLNLFGATTFQDTHPEVFGMALGNEIVPWSGLDFFRDFSADPVNGQPNYQVILGTGGANPALQFEDMGSFLVQPVPLPPALSLFATGIALLGFARKLWVR
jgi:hypothetical protein